MKWVFVPKYWPHPPSIYMRSMHMYVRTADARVRLCGSTASPEPLQLAYAFSSLNLRFMLICIDLYIF